MKSKRLYCPCCKRKTKHEAEETSSTGIRVFTRIVTLGMLSGSQLEYTCLACDNHNYTLDRGFDRYIWARKGTNVYVDQGITGYWT